MPHFMIVLIPYINLLNPAFLDKKCLFEEYRAFDKFITYINIIFLFYFFFQNIDLSKLSEKDRWR